MNVIYWIGGSSCSGKTSCASSISEKYNLHLYNTDIYAFGKYMFEIQNIESYPSILKYRNIICSGMDNMVNMDCNKQAIDFYNYCKEVFQFLLNDIIRLSKDKSVLVEGAHLFPSLIKQYSNNSNNIFLVSNKEHQKNIWLNEMSSEIPGGHPGEIENYQKSKYKKEIEEKRINFHDKIGKIIIDQCILENMKYIMVDGKLPQIEIENKVIEELNLA